MGPPVDKPSALAERVDRDENPGEDAPDDRRGETEDGIVTKEYDDGGEKDQVPGAQNEPDPGPLALECVRHTRGLHGLAQEWRPKR